MKFCVECTSRGRKWTFDEKSWFFTIFGLKNLLFVCNLMPWMVPGWRSWHPGKMSKMFKCHIITYLIISHLTLSYLILSYLILSYLTWVHLISSYLILSYLILSFLILSYLILSYLILSYLNLWTIKQKQKTINP